MSFTFPVLSEEEIKSASGQLSVGIADFEIFDATHKTSKSGNPMIEIKLKIWDKNGTQGTMWDYLVGIPSSVWKIKSLCIAIGSPAKYEEGSISDEFLVGKSGSCELVEQKDKDGKERIRVKDYIDPAKVPPRNGSKPQDPSKDDDMEDDVPF